MQKQYKIFIKEKKFYIYILFSVICIVFFDVVNLDKVSKILLIGLAFIELFIINNLKFANFIKQHTKLIKILSIVIAFFFAFCFIGNNLFLNKLIWDISLKKIVSLIVWSIYFWFKIQFLLFGFEKLSTFNIRKEKEIKSYRKIFDTIFLAVIISFFCVVTVDDIFLKKQVQESNLEILPLQEKGKESKGEEVWILQLNIDGKDQDLSQIELPQGWIYRDQSIIYPGTDTVQPIKLQFSKAKYIYVKFLRHNWSGKVKILDGKKEVIWDLSDKSESYFYEVQSNYKTVSQLKRVIVYLSLFCFFSIGIGYLIYRLLNKIKETYKIHAIENFILFEIIFLIYLWICYPGNCNADIVSQFGQAIGVYPLTNAHPIISTIWIRFLLSICRSLAFLSYTQLTILALCFSLTIYYCEKIGGYKKGILYSKIMILLHIGVGMFAVHLTKDIWYLIALMLLSISLLIIFQEKIQNKAFIYIITLLSSIILIVFRHNGIATVIFCIIAAIFYGIRKKNLTLLIIFLLSIILGKTIAITVEKIYCNNSEEISVGNTINNVLIYNLYGVYTMGGNLSQETEVVLNNIINLKKGEEQYNIYSSDSFNWSYLREEYNDGLSKYPTTEIVKIYIKEFIKSPTSLLTVRLKGNNLLWSVFQPDDAYNERIPIGIFKNADEFGEQNRNPLGIKIIKLICNKIQNIKILDALLWRYGITLMIIITFLIYCIRNKKIEVIFILPALCEWIFYMCFLHVQVFRYSFIMIVCVILLPCVLNSSQNQKMLNLNNMEE